MLTLISFLLVVLISIIIVKIGSVALEMTGLSKDVAVFQAHSAFSGTGFTTSEAEYVVSHPVRRKIIRTLMFLGSAGITSAIVTLMLTFIGKSTLEMRDSLIIILLALTAMYLFFRSKTIDKALRKCIRKILKKLAPSLKIYDYSQLLGITKGYSIAQIKVRKNMWIANKKLRDLELNKEGVLILGIYRKVKGEEVYLGAPRGDIEIHPNDVIICYGPDDVIKEISHRISGAKGNREHMESIKRAEVRERGERIKFEGG